MAWTVEYTDTYWDWFTRLPDEQAATLEQAIEKLVEAGPRLGRPFADRLKHSTIHNLKELRADGAGFHLRVLFVFDPRRHAVLLLGGDKSGQWDAWYRQAVPLAERLYADYLARLRREGLIR